jgi:hypothetical protein
LGAGWWHLVGAARCPRNGPLPSLRLGLPRLAASHAASRFGSRLEKTSTPCVLTLTPWPPSAAILRIAPRSLSPLSLRHSFPRSHRVPGCIGLMPRPAVRPLGMTCQAHAPPSAAPSPNPRSGGIVHRPLPAAPRTLAPGRFCRPRSRDSQSVRVLTVLLPRPVPVAWTPVCPLPGLWPPSSAIQSPPSLANCTGGCHSPLAALPPSALLPPPPAFAASLLRLLMPSQQVHRNPFPFVPIALLLCYANRATGPCPVPSRPALLPVCTRPVLDSCPFPPSPYRRCNVNLRLF